MPKKFLLHTCCAPCGIAVIDELRGIFDLTVFFYNPNIYPKEEYKKRKSEVVKVCREWKVKMIDGDYETKKWFVATKGLEDQPEGGARCKVCFSFRLERSAQEAKKIGAEIFCTTLTMGRNKDAKIINVIGKIIAEKYHLNFFEADWKKNGRQAKADTLVRERNIYRQNYCGCKYSLKQKTADSGWSG